MSALLEVDGLSKNYHYRTGLFTKRVIEAVKPVSFSLEAGETLALIGENGSGSPHWRKCWLALSHPVAVRSG